MKPKIVFITKSLCYHQIGIADKLYDFYGSDFAFIQMRAPLEFRVKNKQEGFERPYLLTFSQDEENNNAIREVLNNASLIIWGEASLKVIKSVPKNVIILKYSERIFKRGYYKTNLFHYLLNVVNLNRLKHFLKKRNAYLLSAGNYSSSDYNKFGLFKNKSMRWGYFPILVRQEKNYSFSLNEKLIKVIWVNRLLKWKHPEYAIEAAKFLKTNNIPFELNIVGDGDLKSGEMKPKMQKLIAKNGLSDCVHMLGKVEPQKVFELYNQSQIALFTSGPAEGWGAGLSEAMSCGCVSIASDKMGSTNYLVKDGQNGYIYKYRDKKSFKQVLSKAIADEIAMKNISQNAVNTISSLWNYEIASERLSKIINQLLNDGCIKNYPEDGPCSLIQGVK